MIFINQVAHKAAAKMEFFVHKTGRMILMSDLSSRTKCDKLKAMFVTNLVAHKAAAKIEILFKNQLNDSYVRPKQQIKNVANLEQ